MHNCLIVGITGASGVVYGIPRTGGAARDGDRVAFCSSAPSAIRTIQAETDHSADEVRRLDDVVHSFTDIGAAISSGSFQLDGTIVAPCSIKKLSGIANS
ncbi:polyprenyl P-hydroxybenzoate/phenylacrylic acid decarboxylase-like protein [Amorphus sp. MBR-141]